MSSKWSRFGICVHLYHLLDPEQVRLMLFSLNDLCFTVITVKWMNTSSFIPLILSFYPFLAVGLFSRPLFFAFAFTCFFFLLRYFFTLHYFLNKLGLIAFSPRSIRIPFQWNLLPTHLFQASARFVVLLTSADRSVSDVYLQLTGDISQSLQWFAVEIQVSFAFDHLSHWKFFLSMIFLNSSSANIVTGDPVSIMVLKLLPYMNPSM